MANTENTWVKYLHRSYQQIKDRVVTILQSKTPELTDHTESNIFVKMLSIWAGLVEMLNYYIDNAARESYTSTVRLYSNMIKLAKTFDYKIKLSYYAYIDIMFEIENTHIADITIPQNTEVKAIDYDYSFYTTEDLIIPTGETSGIIGAKQVAYVTDENIGISDGLANQIFILNEDSIANDTVSVKIGIEVWEPQNTFAFSKVTDKHYVITINENGKIILLFGDNINGAIPTNGEDIILDYQTTLGETGNEIHPNLITEIVSSVTIPASAGELTCYNEKAATGGASIENIERLRANIPKSLRTLLRAVTDLDFKDIAELAPGVMKANVNFVCGFPVIVYIVPLGGGTAPQVLLDSVITWFDDKKIHTIIMDALTAGCIKMSVNVDVQALPGYQNSVIKEDGEIAVKDFLSWAKQGIKDSVYISDIYQIIENVEGVNRSVITSITILPYARVLNGSTELDWIPIMQNNITVDKWGIKMISTNNFQLYKNNLYVGTYNTGVLVEYPEIKFMVNNTYTIGDVWEFYTYKDILVTGMLLLEEYSVIIADLINLNVTGGI